MSRAMLTTVDNPYDPFTQFAEWYAFDVSSGYYTASFLGRIVQSSDQLSDEDIESAMEDAIDEIVKENTLGVYRKVVREE
jgi:hypothetical protein